MPVQDRPAKGCALEKPACPGLFLPEPHHRDPGGVFPARLGPGEHGLAVFHAGAVHQLLRRAEPEVFPAGAGAAKCPGGAGAVPDSAPLSVQ